MWLLFLRYCLNWKKSLSLFTLTFVCLFIVTNVDDPPGDWVMDYEVYDNLTLALYPSDCGQNTPRIEVPGWTKSTVDANTDNFSAGTCIVNMSQE